MRFSLRSLLTLVFLAALMLWVFRAQWEARAQREAMSAIAGVGGTHAWRDSPPSLGGPPRSMYYLGIRESDRLTRVLSLLRHCPDVRELHLETATLERSHWRQIARLPQVDFIAVSEPTESDVAVAGIVRVPGLKLDAPPRGDVAERLVNAVRPTHLVLRAQALQLHFDFRQIDNPTALRSLELYSYLSPRQLADLGRFRALRSLELHHGPLPAGALDGVAQLRRLDTLVLSKCALDSRALSKLPELPNLRRLRIEGTTLDAYGLEMIGRCASLRELSLPSMELAESGLAQLAGLRRLKSLNLRAAHDHYVADTPRWISSRQLRLDRLPTLPALEELRLDDVWAAASPWSELAKMPFLAKLSAEYTNTDATFVPSLLTMPRLQTIRVNWNSLAADDLHALHRTGIRVLARRPGADYEVVRVGSID